MAGKTIFLGLGTYGKVGGLQAFNRRLIQVLEARAKTRDEFRPVILLRQDEPRDLPEAHARADFHACGDSLPKLLGSALRAARGAELIVIGHINLLPVAALCRVVAPRARMVLMVHGVDVWGTPPYRLPKMMDRPLLALVDRIISVSAFTAGRMQAAFGLSADNFRVFRNAVDLLDFPTPQSKPTREILSVARLAEHDRGKNIDKVLCAVAQLAERHPDLTYTHVGDGVLRPELEALAETLGIGERVTFAGRVSDEELSAAYARATAFVLPSEKEGFGIVFLEAWQRYLPVICSTGDAAHEIVTDHVDGFAVDASDIAALADRIEQLVLDPDEARRMGIAGHAKVTSSYLMHAYEQHLNELLDEVSRS